MARFVDGFVLPIAKENLPEYKKLARKACKVFIEHGALDYVECVGDDLDIEGVLTFPKAMKIKEGETVLFAWITYKSKADRNRIMKKVMADPRLPCEPGKMPFDMKRMQVGGFKTIVEA